MYVFTFRKIMNSVHTNLGSRPLSSHAAMGNALLSGRLTQQYVISTEFLPVTPRRLSSAFYISGQLMAKQTVQ